MAGDMLQLLDGLPNNIKSYTQLLMFHAAVL